MKRVVFLTHLAVLLLAPLAAPHAAETTEAKLITSDEPETKVIGDSFRQECSLRAALSLAEKSETIICGRLGKNRHYGDSLGGGLCSGYIAAHPERIERHRGGPLDGTKVSFAIPEDRAERIAVLMEVAQIGAHGLCLDFCRQPPIARYHPQILNPWLKEGWLDEIALNRITALFHNSAEPPALVSTPFSTSAQSAAQLNP